MSKTTREHLSSLMDGELTADAARFLTRRMGSDEELNGAWQRYHLVRDCLRRPGEVRSLTQLRVDLAATEAAGPSPGAVGRTSGALRWLKPVTGSAIAAGVAAAAVLVALNLGPGDAETAPERFTSPNTAGISLNSQPANYDAGSSALNSYLLRHNQAVTAVQRKGFVTLVPIVAPAPVQRLEDEAAPPAAEGAEPANERP